MNMIQHVRSWNGFLGAPQNIRDVLLFIAALLAFFTIRLLRLRNSVYVYFLHYRLYLRDRVDFSCFNYLKFLFSHGVLHSKVY